MRVGLASNFDSLGRDGLTVCGLFALDRVLNCEDMFALVIVKFVVAASAFGLFVIQSDRVFFLLSTLRRY